MDEGLERGSDVGNERCRWGKLMRLRGGWTKLRDEHAEEKAEERCC